MRVILFILSISLSLQLNASHIVGGEMFYDCLGGDQYRITVKIYRDCNSTGAQFDPNLPVTVFDGNNTQINLFLIPFPGSVNLAVNFNNNPCITVPSNICIEEAVYQQVVTLNGSTTGYTLSYQRCCRGPNVTNLVNPGGQGLTLLIEIPPNNVVTCNSSPRFSNYPPLLLCADQTLQFDHSATDPDGDDLSYSLCTPFQGGTATAPAPNPAASPPYNLVNWGGGFSSNSPFGATGNFVIDPVAGALSATPSMPGLYAVGICVTETRNGVVIGTTRRDFLFRVLNCDIELAAEITPQTDLTTYVSFCQGLKVDFENGSFGGTIYHWDFGVPGTTSDVSTSFEPSFIYPGPGTYVVTLIVSKVLGCSDTTQQTFIINDELEADFNPPNPQCITDNSFDFFGTGIIPATTTFSWSFGGGANPATSTDQFPSNIVFSETGLIPVSFSVFYETCVSTKSAYIYVYGEPAIGFGLANEKKCAPYEAEFQNFSHADGPYYSFWEFGDGTTSTQTQPTHYYDPGEYDVKLTIRTDVGCIDTLEIERLKYVEVFPSPTSLFDVDPLVRDEFEAEFTFIDLAETVNVDHYKQAFYFGDGASSSEFEVKYIYPDAGIYFPYQVVENDFGCKDSTRKRIKVVPITTIFVPNTFTPDNNNYNNTFKPILYFRQNYKMWIYDRWGELLFMSEHPTAEWDGTYDGNPVTDGVYIWRIIYHDLDTDIPTEICGHVTLIR